MVEEARLVQLDVGLTPVTDGWFVVSIPEAAWVTNEVRGDACIIEGDDAPFPDIGFTLAVLQPGQSGGRYHREANQEDFLVLAGECVLLIEGHERQLKAWDFFHCPAGVEHVFVGAGDGPCVILMTGARLADEKLLYPVSELAARYGASADEETPDPRQAYARFEQPERGRPSYWGRLPWA